MSQRPLIGPRWTACHLYMSDPAQSQTDVDGLRQALKDSKGPGNFKNLFLYSPNGRPKRFEALRLHQ